MENRIQWEYCQLENNSLFFFRTQEKTPITYSFEEQTKAIAQLGIDGWELVMVWGSRNFERTFYFKRPMQKEDNSHEQ